MCTVLQAGNVYSLAEEVERYKMEVVPLQEIRWKGSIQKSKCTQYYENDNKQGNQGVSFVTSRKINKSVVGFPPYSEFTLED